MEQNYFSKDNELLFECIKEELAKKYDIIYLNNISYKSYSLDTPEMRNGWEFIIDVIEQLKILDSPNTAVCSQALTLCCLMCFDDNYIYFEERYDILLKSIMQEAYWEYFYSRKMLPGEMTKLLTTPYETARFHVSYAYDAVRIAATSGNVGLLQMLLKFGAVFLKPHDDIHELICMKNILMTLFPGDILLFNQTLHGPDSFLRKSSPSSRQRVFLVMRGLEVLLKILGQPYQADMYIASLILLFQSIPEPLITSAEIRKFLEKLLPGAIPHAEILIVCKQYEEYFPESQNPSGPRSLKHLSRCQVRENLRIARHFPVGVNYLRFPATLKRYILLKDVRYLERCPILSMINDLDFPIISSDADNVLFYIPDDY